MANYTGPKVKLSRRVGVPIADIPKHTSKRQLTPPGMHGFRGRRLRDYGVRLNEKQKLRYHYNVMEKQFRLYLDRASRAKGNTGDVMLTLLEQRLDSVIRRMGWPGGMVVAFITIMSGLYDRCHDTPFPWSAQPRTPWTQSTCRQVCSSTVSQPDGG